MTNNSEFPGYEKLPTETPTPSASELQEMVPPHPRAEKHWARTRNVKIGAAVLTVAILTVGGIVFGKMQGGGTLEPGPELGSSAPVMPSEATPDRIVTAEPALVPTDEPTNVEAKPAPSDSEALIESLRIPGDLEPQETAEAFMDRINKWTLAGADEETISRTVGEFYAYNNGGLDDFLDEKSLSNAEIFSSALFPDDWEGSPHLTPLYESAMSANREALAVNMKRSLEGNPIALLQDSVRNAEMHIDDANENLRVVMFEVDQVYLNSLDQEDKSKYGKVTVDVSDGTVRLVNYVFSDK